MNMIALNKKVRLLMNLLIYVSLNTFIYELFTTYVRIVS